MSSEDATNAQESVKEDNNQPQSSGSAAEPEKEAVAVAPVTIYYCDGKLASATFAMSCFH